MCERRLGNVESGSDIFGSIRYAMRKTSNAMLNMCISIRLNMAWLIALLIGHIPVFIGMLKTAFIPRIGVAIWNSWWKAMINMRPITLR